MNFLLRNSTQKTPDFSDKESLNSDYSLSRQSFDPK